jgi:hypothetical protein
MLAKNVQQGLELKDKQGTIFTVGLLRQNPNGSLFMRLDTVSGSSQNIECDPYCEIGQRYNLRQTTGKGRTKGIKNTHLAAPKIKEDW